MPANTWWIVTAPCGCIISAATERRYLTLPTEGDFAVTHTNHSWAGLARCEQHKTPKDNT